MLFFWDTAGDDEPFTPPKYFLEPEPTYLEWEVGDRYKFTTHYEAYGKVLVNPTGYATALDVKTHSNNLTAQSGPSGFSIGDNQTIWIGAFSTGNARITVGKHGSSADDLNYDITVIPKREKALLVGVGKLLRIGLDKVLRL